jgi:hypothetical protein
MRDSASSSFIRPQKILVVAVSKRAKLFAKLSIASIA